MNSEMEDSDATVGPEEPMSDVGDPEAAGEKSPSFLNTQYPHPSTLTTQAAIIIFLPQSSWCV